MTPTPTSPRVLIAYYSRTGNTESVATGLGRASGADLEAIVATSDRRGPLGYLLSGFEAVSEQEGLIQAPKRDPQNYDIVLLGTPTWAAAMSSPVRAYLYRFAGVLPEVGFFVTCGGRGAERVLQQMRYVCGKKPLATLVLTERELHHHTAVYFGDFWERVLCAWEARTKSESRTPSKHEQASFGML